MPFPLLAHQAPVLPLKIWRPRWFSGTALVVGSLAPDLANLALYARPRRAAWIAESHSLLGVLVFCVPASMLIVWTFSCWVAEPLARHLPHGPPLHLEDLRLASLRTHSTSDWARIAASAFVGALTHIAMDAFTRGTGAIAHLWPWLARPTRIASVMVSPSRAMQYVGTPVLAIASAAMALQLLRGRWLRTWAGDAATAQAPPLPRRPVRYWVTASAFGAIGFVFALPVVRDGARYFEHPRIYAWMAVAFLAACVFYVGLCVAGAASIIHPSSSRGSQSP